MMNGRLALITGVGAVNGIGFASARVLAERGFSLLLVSHSDRAIGRAHELQRAHPDLDIHGFSCDLTVESEVNQLFASFEKLEGATGGLVIDVLVNNAGMTSVRRSAQDTGESAAMPELSLAGWRASLERNLTSAFLVSRSALPYLRKSRSGRIINIASVTGPVMAMRSEVGYASAKAGMVGLTRALALDEAKNAITVNSISPGWIATESQTEHEKRNGLLTPLARSGTAEEIASAVAWLASEGAAYTTGQNIVIDGGNSIAEERA